MVKDLRDDCSLTCATPREEHKEKQNNRPRMVFTSRKEAGMTKLGMGLLFGMAALSAHGQSIEGYWQDTERRILFSHDAPPGYVYGRWTALDQEQTYPSAKQIRRAGADIEVVE